MSNNKELKCPNCGSENFTSESPYWKISRFLMVVVESTCDDCGTRFRSVHELSEPLSVTKFNDHLDEFVEYY